MGSVTVHGLTAAEKHMQERAKRVRDLSPVMKAIGVDLVTETQKSLRNSTSPKGEAWAGIKDETKLGRASVRKRANQRTKRGSLTKGALKFRAGLLASSKPLVDTGRLKNSANASAGRRSVRFTMVGYTGPHITGSAKNNLPKRNPTAFEQEGGRWRLVPRLREKYAKKIRDWIEDGRQ